MNNSEIGNQAESYACIFLIKERYKILAKNWRSGKAEIDIIAFKDNTLVFVEVKSRSCLYFGEPEHAVDRQKERLIFHAAQRYMELHDYEWAIRFDVIAIHLDALKRPYRLKHILDVFF